MKNSADQGGCYPQRPKAEVDNTLRDLQNSSYPTKAEFNNCFNELFVFLLTKNNIICSQLHFWRHFDIIGAIICRGLHFWRHSFNITKILSKFGEQQLVMKNYACGFNQSEMGKYFEWTIIQITFPGKCSHSEEKIQNSEGRTESNDKGLVCYFSIKAYRPLQKRERAGKEYGCFPFVWKTKILKWKINYILES